jgi:alkylhydroperoxidase/carboxymuconolactone decarboxylase family protein YurZ
MEKSYPLLIAELEKTDKRFFESVKLVYDLATGPGELDGKTKILISLALDAALGLPNGVKALADTARSMGISDAQIAEALRLAYLTAGMGTLAASKAAF